jgi:phosphoribosylanthranilate isomerase
MSPSNIWIKICGNTSLADARVAADSGANAVGFVFAPSPRRVTPRQVAAIVPHLPAALEKIGVFVDASFEEIETTILTTGLTGVQLHFDAAPALPINLRDRFGLALRILRVIHFSAETAKTEVALIQDSNVDAMLIDSRTATAVGGTGQSFDWTLASKTIFQNAAGCKLVAAGGLSPENVAQAITTLRPWGVDVVSGVEVAPGHKDPAKVQAFISGARRAIRS